MGRPPKELTPGESALHFYGAELRHWRMLRALSQEKLGLRTHHSGDLISKIEKGERFPSLAFTRSADRELDTGGALEKLWSRAEQERANRAAAARTPTSSSEPLPADLGLVWPATAAATVEVVGALWRADMERRSVLLTAPWLASAFAEPVREWLLHRHDEIIQGRSGRQVGQHDIDALWAMSEAFTDADHRLGGGYAQATLMNYVNQTVFPLLNGSYPDAIGRELLAATARLCGICAYTSYDSGRQGLAQRYFVQALRLAQASGNRMLGAHILGDMSHQARHLGNATQAVELATAGYRTALDSDSPSTVARCALDQGEAHALRGDERASAQACTVAESMLDRATPTGERAWTYRVTAEDVTARRLLMARDLGRHGDVQRIAPAVLAASAGRARRQVLCTTALAASYLPADDNPHADIDHACEVLGQALPALASLRSAHTLDRVNTVRRALAAHADRPSVQEFEDRFRTTLTAA